MRSMAEHDMAGVSFHAEICRQQVRNEIDGKINNIAYESGQ